jgi:hypothetical protein
MADYKNAFWSDSGAGVEPKRKYRWVLTIGQIPQYIIKKVKKPAFKVSETPHDYINHKFYYPGRVEWELVNCTLVDPVHPDAAATMMAILLHSGYAFPDNAQVAQNTISKQRGTSALGRVEISQIDSEGAPIESWVLTNAWLQRANFGDLDYSSDDLTEIEIDIRYDWAELITIGSTPPIGGA